MSSSSPFHLFGDALIRPMPDAIHNSTWSDHSTPQSTNMQWEDCGPFFGVSPVQVCEETGGRAGPTTPWAAARPQSIDELTEYARIEAEDAMILTSMLGPDGFKMDTNSRMTSPVATSDLPMFYSNPHHQLQPLGIQSPSTLPFQKMMAMCPSPTSTMPVTNGVCRTIGCDNSARMDGWCKGHGNGRQCLEPGCTKNSQSNGRCIRHGGGKRCIVEDCPRGAQARGKCKAHGGGVRCKVDGCMRSSQGSGLCRTHGGGKLCNFPGCVKGTQRHGKCSTHGGARRCTVTGCTKVDRGGGLCGTHKKTKTLVPSNTTTSQATV